MIVLHAGFHDDLFVIWGERGDSANEPSSATEPAVQKKKSKSETNLKPKKEKSKGKEEHPFALEYHELIDTINGIMGGTLVDGSDARTVNIWLPSNEAGPVASDSLYLETETENEKSSEHDSDSDSSPALQMYAVNAVVMEGPRFVAILDQAQGRHILKSGAHLSDEFDFFFRTLQFAASMVVRQQYLPTIKARGKSLVGFWEPVLAGDDHSRLTVLSDFIPYIVRSICPGSLAEQKQDAPRKKKQSLALPKVETTIAIAQGLLDGIVKRSIEQCERDRLATVATSEATASVGGATVDSRKRGTANAKTNSEPLNPHTAAFEQRYGRGNKARAEEEPRQPGLPLSQFESVHDCWLSGLRLPSGKLDFDRLHLAKFIAELADWQMPATAFNAAPFRLCFHLEEPNYVYEQLEFVSEEALQAKWNVHYLLQSTADPSLLIPAAQAWQSSQDMRVAFADNQFRPREHLLLSLAKASNVAPAILESLTDPNPTGFQLDNQGAFKFLTETVPALAESGFALLLPKWWTDKGRRRLKMTGNSFRLASGAEAYSEGRFSLQSLMKFDWRVSLGDTVLTLQELEALASLKSPLVNIRGEWVHVNAADIQAIIKFIKQKGGVSATLQDVIRYATGAETPVADGADVEVNIQAEGWLNELLSELKSPAQFSELMPATTFNGVLRPYQKRGFSWLRFLSGWGMGACLADDMGLGKTIQTLALIQKRKEETGGNPALLVCPTSVVDNWRKECEKFTPDLRLHIHHGGKRTKGISFRQLAMDHDLVISSYSLLDRDKEFLMDVAWSGVILDEAQNIKNPESKQAKAAGEISCGYKIALTGTPVENGVGDLWSIMNFLNPGLLGTQKRFRSEFFEPIQLERDKHTKERLQAIVKPFILRRLKTDKTIIDDLPDKQEMNVYCSLTKEQATLYRAVTKELSGELKTVEASSRSALVLATMTRLKQICNHPAQYLGDKFGLSGRSGKFARLEEMLEEVLACQDKALIFSQFAEMGKMLHQHFEQRFGSEILFLHGGTSIRRRNEMVEQFQSTGGPPLFILSLKAGGTGLNLTAANHVFHFDRWWNPAVENQATDRAFRIGQKKNVQVHKFICAGTLEEKIDALIRSKQELADDVVGTGEGWLTKLSNEDLRDVFALSQEVFVE